ncbi:MAG TPA: DUF2971 domain-containing protein [Alphaproteobacteria bacterium]|nr:DUF2971 domain-containing protein [Alphaproteobacteria bacterium]
MEETVSQTYKNLYHYTNISGALGIINSNQLWATHCRFLNDTTERVHALESMYHQMQPRVLEIIRELEKEPAAKAFLNLDAEGGAENLARDEARKIINALNNAAGNECYVVSLCGETPDEYVNKNGLLSQWRGYGKDGGAALVFDTKELEDHLKKEAAEVSYSYFCLASLFYEDDFKTPSEEASKKISTVVRYGEGYIRETVLNQPNPVDTGEAYAALANIVSRYKHRAFKEENEVRIIAWPIYHSPKYKDIAKSSSEPLKPEKTRFFRDSLGGITPFIKLFEQRLSGVEKLPIKKIIIGPHKDKDKRKEALEIALRGQDIKIEVSEIPYVG